MPMIPMSMTAMLVIAMLMKPMPSRTDPTECVEAQKVFTIFYRG